jgi:hypothetical protein
VWTRQGEQGALSGSFVMRHREILRQRVGAEAFRRVLAALEPAAREAISSARSESWVPVDHLEALYLAIAGTVGENPVDLHVEVATQVAEQLVRTVWRILLGLSTDSALIPRATVFYAKSYNRGTLTAKLMGPGSAEAVLDGWPDAPELTLRGVRIALDTVLRLAGRTRIAVIAERHARGARWQMSWHA